VGYPFLSTHPASYLGRAFELGRVFFHTWTVNWKFLPVDVFESPTWAAGLLAGHLGTLAVLALGAWSAADGGLWRVLWRAVSAPPSSHPYRDSPAFIIYLLWACNFVGIAFARTLHYQFLAWYWPSLPLLLARTRLPFPVALAVLVAIEVAFNTGDEKGAGSASSSAALQGAHFTLLAALLAAPDLVPAPWAEGKEEEGEKAPSLEAAQRGRRRAA
jgi:alpha-1,3-mannosyltransferase